MTAVTTAGCSFKKNGSAWSVSSVTGSGTTWTFTMGSSAAYGDTLLRSYDSTTGATIGTTLELVSFTDSSVTNSVAGASYDTDAQAYFDAQATAGYTMSTTEKDAWDDFVVSAKADGTWAAIVAAYPMNLANNLTGIKLNAKNPVDSDAGKRLTVTGGATITYASGTVDKATSTSSTYFNTFVTGADFENPQVDQVPCGMALYFPNSDLEIGGQDVATAGDVFSFYSDSGATTAAFYGPNASPHNVGAVANAGIFSMQINNTYASPVYRFKEGASAATTYTGGTYVSFTSQDVSFLKSGRKCGFLMFFKALSNTDFDALNGKIQTYLTALGK
jgi:hypothetical protein